jgi:hypothetical protein
MFRWIVKFSIGITEHIKERSHFPESVIVFVSLVWLFYSIAKMQKSKYMKK